jgi:hypothetical protein
MPPLLTVLAITRLPVSAIPKPDTLTIDKLEEWFDTWIKTFEPALLGVYPEKPIYIYYIDLKIPGQPAPKVDVIAVDYKNPPKLTSNQPRWITDFNVEIDSVSLPLPVGLIEVCAYLPDMVGLETSDYYVRNALMMGFSVKVKNQNSEFSGATLPFPVWLPAPSVREPVWADPVTVVDPEKPNPPAIEIVSNYLGKVANPDSLNDVNAPFGQVRWYSSNIWDLSNLTAFVTDFFHIDEMTKIDQQKLTLSVPTSISDKLGEIRRAGEWLIPDKLITPVFWDDDWVKFDIPHDSTLPNNPEKPGFVIIWRDDIPSRVLSFVNVAEYVETKIQAMARQLWRQSVNKNPVIASIPIPLGDLIKVGVERLAGEANAYFDSILVDNDFQVHFAFTIVDESSSFKKDNFVDENCRPISVGDYQVGFDPGQPGLSSKEIAFKYRPVCSSKPLDPEKEPEKTGAFSLQLSVRISFTNDTVTLFNRKLNIKPLQIDLGLPVIFHPVPLVIPTLAIFFFNRIEVSNDAFLVMLPKDTGLFGKNQDGSNKEIHIDANTPGDFNEVRVNITSELARLKTALDLVKDFKIFGPNPALTFIDQVAATAYSIGTCVIDSKGEIDDLRKWVYNHRNWIWGGDQTFNDELSAVILIGTPKSISFTEIQCFQHISYNQGSASDKVNGGMLTLSIPDSQFIAALPAFTALDKSIQDMAAVFPNLKAFDVPKPTVGTYVGTTAKNDGTYVGTTAKNFTNFDNAISSIMFAQTGST